MNTAARTTTRMNTRTVLSLPGMAAHLGYHGVASAYQVGGARLTGPGDSRHLRLRRR
jgi:hypothetical protein